MLQPIQKLEWIRMWRNATYFINSIPPRSSSRYDMCTMVSMITVKYVKLYDLYIKRKQSWLVYMSCRATAWSAYIDLDIRWLLRYNGRQCKHTQMCRKREVSLDFFSFDGHSCRFSCRMYTIGAFTWYSRINHTDYWIKTLINSIMDLLYASFFHFIVI